MRKGNTCKRQGVEASMRWKFCQQHLVCWLLVVTVCYFPRHPRNFGSHVAAGTVWATTRTNENMRRRQLEPSQSFTAGMPAKMNESQLRRHAGYKDWDDQCCRPLLFSYRNSIPGSTSLRASHSRLRRSLARSRETRFTRPNRRACSQAKAVPAATSQVHRRHIRTRL